MATDCLKKLEYLSLLSKVCWELESNIGFADKVLAEFITHIGRSCKTIDEFNIELRENGALFPDYLVRTLFTIIHAIVPLKPDSQKDVKEESSVGKQLKKNRRDNGDNRSHNREDGEHGRLNRDRKIARYHSNEAELYRVYKGRVSRVMDAGCFVRLNDLKGKEGLVHVSQISNRRISSAKDSVKRDQEVFVKVISVSGQKLGLSMRDVDQNIGKDSVLLKRTVWTFE